MIKNKYSIASALLIGLVLSVVFVTFVTIYAEYNANLKNWFATTHGHHWVGKGIWAGIVFVVMTLMSHLTLRQKVGVQAVTRALTAATYMLAFGTALIFAFFIYHYTLIH